MCFSSPGPLPCPSPGSSPAGLLPGLQTRPARAHPRALARAHPRALARALRSAGSARPSSGSGRFSTFRPQPQCPQGGSLRQKEPPTPLYCPPACSSWSLCYTSPACLLPTLCLQDKLEAAGRQGLGRGARHCSPGTWPAA